MADHPGDETALRSPSANDASTRGLRRSLIYFATVAMGQGISFLLLPFVTRALDPGAYGAYALALAVSSLVGMVASSWVRNVALRLYFEAAARGTTRGFFLGTAALQAASFSALYAVSLAGFVAFGFELASLRVMVSAGVTVLLGDLAVHTGTLLRAEQRTSAFAVTEIGAGVIRFALTLGGLGFGLRSPELLFDPTSAGYLLAAAYGVPRLWRRLEGPARLDHVGTREVIRHGPAALPFSVADWIERLADRLVLEHFLGTAVVGVYSVGYTVGERILGTLVRSVFLMAWPNILAAWKDTGTAGARDAVYQAQVLYMWFTCGPAVFMLAFGGDLVRMIAGPAYHDAAPIVGLVSASMWLAGYTSYLNRHLELRKRFAVLSSLRMVGALLNLALNLWWVPLYGMLGAAWATMANRALNALVFFAIRDRSLVRIPVATIASALGWSGVAYLVAMMMPTSVTGMAAFVTLYTPVAIMAMRRLR